MKRNYLWTQISFYFCITPQLFNKLLMSNGPRQLHCSHSTFVLIQYICVLLRLRVQNRRRKTKFAAQFQHYAVNCVMVYSGIFHTSTRFSISGFQHALTVNIFNTCLKFWHSFLHALQFSTYAEIFNMLFYSFQNMPWNFQHAFLQFSEHSEISTCFFTVFRTCAEILNTQHAFLQFSEHSEIFNMLFLQFSEHSEIFNMLFHSFQNMLKFSTCFFIVLNTLFQYAYNMHYRFQHALKFSTHFQTWKFKTFTVKLYFYVVQIYVNQGSYKLSMTDPMVDRSITDLTVILLKSLCKLLFKWRHEERYHCQNSHKVR